MFKEMYKQNIDLVGQQEQRRRTLLEQQKQKRLQLQDGLRDLELPEIEIPRFIPSIKSGNKRRTFNFSEAYQSDRSLQLSEWLRERPDQLEDWLLLPCPRGQRCMVVACRGRTEVYSKNGRRRFSFRSMLPGDGLARSLVTMLDCVYAPAPVDTFYVLDSLAYGNQDLVDCEAQFRFFWLRSKFDENDGGDLGVVSARNEKRFCLLDPHDFENAERVAVALQRYPLWPDNRPELDGFLFYHKEASYTCGSTPLVGWLFAFMVPDVLGLQVSDAYERPEEYNEPNEYMDSFDKALEKNRVRRSKRPSAMETEECVSDVFDHALEVHEASLNTVLDAERHLELEGIVAEKSTEPLDC